MQLRHTTAAAVLALTAALILSACGAFTTSSDQQKDRLQKAAGIGTITLVMTPDLWTGTRPDDLKKVSQQPADGDPGRRGLVDVTLTGAQLVDYLDELNNRIHPGWMDDHYTGQQKALARRVYNSLGPAVDHVTNATAPGDPAPQVLIDDTLPTTAP